MCLSASRVLFFFLLGCACSLAAHAPHTPARVFFKVSVPTHMIHGAEDDIAYTSGSEEMKSLLAASSDVELQVRQRVDAGRREAGFMFWHQLESLGVSLVFH